MPARGQQKALKSIQGMNELGLTLVLVVVVEGVTVGGGRQ